MNELIMQMQFILLPILLYEMYWNHKLTNHDLNIKQKIAIGILCSLSILGCITYSTIMNGFKYDLRDVPLIVAILYGGYEVGFAVTALLLLFRFIIGGVGFYLTLFIHIVILPVVFYSINSYPRYSIKSKLNLVTIYGLSFSIVTTIISTFNFWIQNNVFITADTLSTLYPLIIYVIGVPFGVRVTVYLIEKSRENASLMFELQESEKLRVVSHLAASIAHEVRNPLTVVRGFIQLLTKDEIDPEKKKQYSQMMINELDRAQDIISEYLTYARPESDLSSFEKIDVKQMIQNAVHVMLPFGTQYGVTIEMELDENLYVQAERNKFLQVIVNLIKNAIEAMPKGGIVTVRSTRQNDHIVIDIVDQGTGIPKEKLERLGKPFFSTKEKGTGLGLMVCYRIIQSMNGEIKVTSEVEKGTHFCIVLPLSTDPV